MGPTAEAISHFVHGTVTAYFLTWTIFIWNHRKQSNMMYMLFVCMLYISFCNVKEIAFLFKGLADNFFWNGLSLSIDTLGAPLVANFFMEVVCPGWVTRRKVLLLTLIQALFIPLFIAFPTQFVLNIAMYTAFGASAVTLILACFMLFRHRKYIRDNFSYTEHVDVNWAINLVIVLFLCTTVYVINSANESFATRAAFHLVLMFSWIYLNNLARKHSVVDIPSNVMFAFPLISRHQEEEAVPAEDVLESSSDIHIVIASQLEACMRDEQLYLNPKLTLQDVCSAIGTNRTYLSDYLNNVLKTTFYDYVNELRIRTACEIMDAMTPETKRPIVEIAEVSGFNSISTFNRAFVKLMSTTPGQYMSRKKS
jgi:AraC-like DNA-binding protein